MKFITSIVLASVLLVISGCKKPEEPAPVTTAPVIVYETPIVTSIESLGFGLTEKSGVYDWTITIPYTGGKV
jgi:hypothetical protein